MADKSTPNQFGKEMLSKIRAVAGPVERAITLSSDGEVIEIVETHKVRQESSIEFTVDSKGYVKPTVKVYHEDPLVAQKLAMEILTNCIKFANEASA